LSLLAGAFALAVPLVLGLLLLALTCAHAPYRLAIGNFALAHLVGCGAITILLLLNQLVFGKLSVLPVYGALLILLSAWKHIGPRMSLLVASQRGIEVPVGSRRNATVLKILLLFIGICVLATTLSGFKAGLGWDAWSFWQLKARAFYIEGNMLYLKDTAHCFHPEYPPMIPLLSYWVFAHARSTAELWPQIIGLTFYLDLLAISYASLRLWIDTMPALACTALVASSRVVQKYALAGYADVAASVFMLATAVFLARRFVDKDKTAGPPLLWMLAVTCLVKNETIAWTLAALLIICGYGVIQRARAALISIGAFAAGLLPWFWLQHVWHLRDEMTTKAAGSLSASTAFASALDIATHLAKYSIGIGPQYPAWGLSQILVITGLILAARHRNQYVLPLLLLVMLQFISYVVVIVWAIWVDPGWTPIYMNDTLYRCLLQVYPTALLLAGLGCFASARPLNGPDAHATEAQKDLAAAPVN